MSFINVATMTVFDVRKHEFCVPIIDGMVVPNCYRFTVLPTGECIAQCFAVNGHDQKYVINERVAEVEIRGFGLAIPISGPSEYHLKAGGIPRMPLSMVRV